MFVYLAGGEEVYGRRMNQGGNTQTVAPPLDPNSIEVKSYSPHLLYKSCKVKLLRVLS